MPATRECTFCVLYVIEKSMTIEILAIGGRLFIDPRIRNPTAHTCLRRVNAHVDHAAALGIHVRPPHHVLAKLDVQLARRARIADWLDAEGNNKSETWLVQMQTRCCLRKHGSTCLYTRTEFLFCFLSKIHDIGNSSCNYCLSLTPNLWRGALGSGERGRTFERRDGELIGSTVKCRQQKTSKTCVETVFSHVSRYTATILLIFDPHFLCEVKTAQRLKY